jgi:hypothetical protein
MKIKIFAYDHELKENINSGGTIWFQNISMAFNSMGHDSEVVSLDQPKQADLLFIQSEWAHLPCWTESVGKKIIILGHFKGGVYHDPTTLQADHWVSTWQGDVVDNFPHEVIYMPHAYSLERDRMIADRVFPCPFVGNTYPLRKEDWIGGLPVQKMTQVNPDELSDLYRRATVCPNFHGDFQKGVVSTEPSRIAEVPGFSVNERLFWISGAGGFQVVDNNPLVLTFFSRDEVVIAKNPKDFQKKVRYFLKYPEKREEFIKRGKDIVLNNHTYQHRLTNLLNKIQ